MASAVEAQFLKHINNHRNIIYKIARMYMNNPEDQQDLSQEIIIQLWKAYGSFRNESQFSTWMYRVALNTAITFFKKEKRSTKYVPIDEEATAVPENLSNEKNERLAAFYRAVQSLNNIEKAIVFLYLENQSHREIAEKLGISEGNTRVKLARAKDKLQELVKQQQ